MDAAKAKAADYIALFVANITDPFQMSIVAYALMTVSHARSDDAIARLNSMRRSSMTLIQIETIIIKLMHIILLSVLVRICKKT